MRKLFYLMAACTAMVCWQGCANKASEEKESAIDSVRVADSLVAAEAVVAGEMYNDSISRADSVQQVDSAKVTRDEGGSML